MPFSLHCVLAGVFVFGGKMTFLDTETKTLGGKTQRNTHNTA